MVDRRERESSRWRVAGARLGLGLGLGLGLATLGCSSGSADTGTSGDASGEGVPPLIDLLLGHNDLNVAGIEIECEVCGCAGISGEEAEGWYCVDRVVRELHAELVDDMRRQYQCLIPIARDRLDCLEGAVDCAATEVCETRARDAETGCAPDVSFEALGRDLQTECGDG